MNRFVAIIVAAAIGIGASGCSQRYAEFPIWQGYGQQPIVAKKKLIWGTGGSFSAFFDKLEAKDVDGAIAVLEADSTKNYMGLYNLAVMYEVAHDWAKAEETINRAIEDYAKSKTDKNKMLEDELAFIQENKTRSVGQ